MGQAAKTPNLTPYQQEGRQQTMEAIAIIPARGGSKGVPRKNVRPLCGKPLIVWSIESAQAAKSISRVVVSTDDPEIAVVSQRAGAEVVWRPAELSGDQASSEAALLHALQVLGIREGALAFIQCTAPLLLPADIDGTVAALHSADSAFTATPSHKFLWRSSPEGVVPLGHDRAARPMRQQMTGEYMEVGAVYAVRVERFLTERTRFAGRSAVYPIPDERSLEIDTETDFQLAEALMRLRLASMRAASLPPNLRAVVTDFDGVLTDNTVVVHETGREAVRCHRGDGWALSQLKSLGLEVLILTNERNPVVRHRADKLGVECIVTDDKLDVLRQWLSQRRIPAEDVVYVGNDAPDVPCMLHVGCGVAPSDAQPVALRAARIVLERRGGEGCLRELVELVMSQRGEMEWST